MFMNISFIGVLTKPLWFKIVLKLIFNLFLLFLPAILSAHFLGMENIIFKIALSIALIILNGYLWTIFAQEVQYDDNDFPKMHFINNFFIGLKGMIFFLGSIILLAAVLFALWLIIQYVPNSRNISLIVAAIWFIYWLFIFNPVAMGLFSENFDPFEALNFSTIGDVINGSWLNYLIAILYIFGYIFIIGMTSWAFILVLGPNLSHLVLGIITLYAIFVYFLLYAKVFKHVKTEFESHF